MKTMIAAILFGCMATSFAAEEWDMFTALDKNEDGKVTQAEWMKKKQKQAEKKDKTFDEEKEKALFAARDADGDGSITREEFEATQPEKKEKKNK